MKVFIVHAHPEPKSLNGELTRAAVARLQASGHEVQVSDLHEMFFNPISDRSNFTFISDPDYFEQQLEELAAAKRDAFAADIEEEMNKLFWCDVLILQFPLWWWNMPAIMKGWVDRVFAMGKIYDEGKQYDKGVFAGKKAMVSVTVGGPAEMFTPRGLHGDLSMILYPINHGILYFTGFTPLEPFVVYNPLRMTPEEKSATIARYLETLDNLNTRPAIPYPSAADYDEHFQLRC